MKMEVRLCNEKQSHLHYRKLTRTRIRNSTHKPKQNIFLNEILKNVTPSILALYKHVDGVLQNVIHSSTHYINSLSH